MIRQLSFIELHSDDPKRALRFYGTLFNAPVHSEGKGGGGMGLGDAYFAVLKTPKEPTLPEFGVDVDDLEPYLARLRSQGVQYEGPTEIESSGRRFLQVMFSDPDGRTVSLFQPVEAP